jgi:hypothetical protein
MPTGVDLTLYETRRHKPDAAEWREFSGAGIAKPRNAARTFAGWVRPARWTMGVVLHSTPCSLSTTRRHAAPQRSEGKVPFSLAEREGRSGQSDGSALAPETMMTTFPTACPASKCRIAAGASSSG